MKTRVTSIIPLLALLAGSIASSYGQAAKSPLEGTWEMVASKFIVNGQEVASMPGTFTGQQLKVYSKGYYVFVGRFKDQNGEHDNFGGGTYSLMGETYVENRLFHAAKERVGTSVHYKLVVQGDTMTLSGPLLPEEEKLIGGRLEETYKRKD